MLGCKYAWVRCKKSGPTQICRRLQKRTDLCCGLTCSSCKIHDHWCPNLDLACPCVPREDQQSVSIIDSVSPSTMRYSPTSDILPPIINSLCSLILRFKSIRSFAGAQIRLSLIVNSLRRVIGSIGRSWCAICVAAASVARDTCVVSVARYSSTGNPSSSELELVRMTDSSNFAPADHCCSSNSRWSAQMMCS